MQPQQFNNPMVGGSQQQLQGGAPGSAGNMGQMGQGPGIRALSLQQRTAAADIVRQMDENISTTRGKVKIE
jgi:hypothetical protein